MRLKEIHLTNFRCFEQLDVQLNDRLAVFLGVNGAGKTAILDAICLYFIQIASGISANNVTIQFSDDITENIKIGCDEAALIFSSEYLDFKEIQADISVQSDGGTVTSLSKDVASLFKSFKEKTKFVNSKDEFSVPILLHFKSNKGQSEKVKTHSRTNFLQFTTYENSFFHSIDDFKDFTNWFREAEDRENETIILKKDFNAKNPQLEIIRKTIPYFLGLLNNQAFSDLRIKRQTNNKFEFKANGTYSLIIKKEGQILELNQLSDGERTLIMLVSDITRRLILANPSLENPLEGEGIVLIDEIDLHLHPQWQRNILPALLKTFPECQFIVTTHSPLVISNVARESVFILDNGKLIKNTPHTLGRDYVSILYNVFGVEERPIDYQKKIDACFRLIENEQYPEAKILLKKLSEELGEDDIDIVRANVILDMEA